MSFKNKLNVTLLLAYCVCLLALTVCKSFQLFLPELAYIEKSLGGDKWQHFTLALILSYLVWPVAWRWNGQGSFARVKFTLAVFLLLVSALLADEFPQYFIKSRYFEWRDILYGVSGLFLGLAIRLLFARFLRFT
jgi:VanZ family protein